MLSIKSTAMTLKNCIAVLLLSHAFDALAAATEAATTDTVAETQHSKLNYIVSLDEHCKEDVCRGFHYPNVSDIAFFDLKTAVHITPEHTYDITTPLQYDTLTFEQTTFAHFPLHLFYCISVKELDLRNCSMEMLTWENFLMADKLHVLLLSHNRITNITEMTFNYASELQYLFLDSNRIRQLDSKAFKGLTKLRFLDLKNNRLKFLPADIFGYLPALQELYLAQNRLRVVGNELFARNPQLKTVTLRDNRLRELGDYAFKSATGLMLLDISHNDRLQVLVSNLQVRYLDAANCSLYRVNIYGTVANVEMPDNRIMELYFSQPQALETLNLRNNALQQIASLSRATKLESLILADNPNMRSLPEVWSANSLLRLDLSNISLKAMPIAALSAQPNLRALNVSNNQLRDINPRNFKYLEKLTHFYIHSNDWNCYNLKMIMDLLIIPENMAYTRDEFDADFPGEYINGIACMYRIEDGSDDFDNGVSAENDDSDYAAGTVDALYTSAEDALKRREQLNAAESTAEAPQSENIHQELKAIVSFYDAKFDKAFAMIDDLNRRLKLFEKLNETFWQQSAIIV